MSDYLNHVAARQLNLTSQIQPRLPALFEPVAPAAEMIGVEESLDWNERSEVNEVSAVVRPAPLESPVTVAQPPLLPPPFSQPAEPSRVAKLKLPPISPPVPARLAAPPVEVVPRPPIEPVSPLVAQLSLPPVQAALTPPAASDRSPLPSPGISEPPQPMQVAEKLVVPPARPVQVDLVIEPSLLSQPAAGHLVEPPVFREAALPTPLLVETAPARLPAKTIRPPTALVRPPASVPPGETPTPTIQVTIGRIEIRATPASPPKKEARATSPVMSLDEYLRRRSPGGSR